MNMSFLCIQNNLIINNDHNNNNNVIYQVKHLFGNEKFGFFFGGELNI